jgi:DNA-binding winged helix-turn-helix (wHTH) protein
MYKNSSVLESKTGSRANAVPDIHLGKKGETWSSSSEVIWEQDLPPISNGLSQRHMRADSLELDGYQVALIAPENRVDHADSSAPAPARPAHVFVLPLTWKDLAVLMRADGNSNSMEANRIFRFGQVGVDFGGMNVTRAGKMVALTSLEFKMLKFLLKRPGQVISRDELLNEVWGYDNYPNTRTVDNHILRLRQKLERDPANPVHFLTVHSAGYKFVP